MADGDTITVRFFDGIERRVRLIGVDAPEMTDPREEMAWRAFLSRRFVFHYLYRRDVRLSFDFSPLDEHGRVLAYVWDARGGLFNELIIRRGFAAAFLKYPFRKDFQKRFRSAAAEARREGRGFWATDDPEEIPVSDVPARFGDIVTVRFLCVEVLKKQAFIILRASGSEFEALIPRNRASQFPGVESWSGKEVRLTGLAEEFAGRPQIILSFPRQLRLT